MKDLVTKSTGFTRIEFWVASTIFVFVIFFFITDSLEGSSRFNNTPYRTYFEASGIQFDFYTNYFIPQLIQHVILFAAFFYLNFIIIPQLLEGEALLRNICLVLVVYLIAGAAFGITDTYLKGYLYARYKGQAATEEAIFRDSYVYALWLLFVLALYSAIKYVGLYLLHHTEAITNRYRFITKEGIAAFVIWMIGLFLIVLAESPREIVIGWMVLVPSGIMLYQYGFYKTIPASLPKKHPFFTYILKNAVILVIAYFPIAFIILFVTEDDDIAFAFSFFNAVFQLFITLPITWVLFKRKIKGNEELFVLKKELVQSNANFDFLRSQINPHFLFNALNTIYGTAIQEKAERTSEGIEKLGDMMRFMLQENMQDKISLAREIDYLNNYIGLQKLRTDPNPGIQIHTELQNRENTYQIAPMLLIPFVENAFKHGISFREPSHIKVALEIKDKTLYFDVYNSKHAKLESDPERDKSGIGLENVKQRLKHLYPNKHELIIRETGKEFFIHLTIQLV